jgi:transcription elongation GreA/GreB family factor
LQVFLFMKSEIKAYYQQLLQDRIDVFQDMIAQLTDGAQNDAKGSAGDKHETALSMMHLEQEKLAVKLQEVLQQKAIIDRMDPSVRHTRVALGSLVEVNGLRLFIAAALPKITLGNHTILAVSTQAPLGSALWGQTVGYSTQINGKNYTITAIW